MGPETPGPMGLIGRVIGGYRLERVLGTGETSAVLLGQHVDAPEQRAVLKILMLPSEASAAVQRELRGAFSREAQTHFALQHPHIVGIYAFGVDVVTGSPYMVLPYPHGGTLAERLAGGALPLPTAAQVLSQLADALDAAHALGIVHSDVSADNVLLDEQEQVYLSGFSATTPLRTATDALSDSRMNPAAMAESAAYWAPERAGGQDVRPAADIYSLGVVLYQMVTGYVPFQGATHAIVLLQHAQLPPPPPRALRPELTDAAEAAILRALAKQPSERFATASALAEAFTRGLAGAAAPESELHAVGPAPAPTAPPQPQGPTVPIDDSDSGSPASASESAAGLFASPSLPAATPLDLAAPLVPAAPGAPDAPTDQASTISPLVPTISAPAHTEGAPAVELPPNPGASAQLGSQATDQTHGEDAAPEPEVSKPDGHNPDQSSAVAHYEDPTGRAHDAPTALPPASAATAAEDVTAGDAAPLVPIVPVAAIAPPALAASYGFAGDIRGTEAPANASANGWKPAGAPSDPREPGSPAGEASPAAEAPVAPTTPPESVTPTTTEGSPDAATPPASLRSTSIEGPSQEGSSPIEASAIPASGRFHTPVPAMMMRIVLPVVLAVALVVAAVAVVTVLGVFEAALMAVVLALLAFVVIAVPNKPGGSPVNGLDGGARPSIAGVDGTDARGDGRGAEQLAQVRNRGAVPARS